jgi:Mrp family chromosome partitioning ATPase
MLRPDAPHVFRPIDEASVPVLEEEMPFIEVGGPNKTIEASPSVLAAGPPPRESRINAGSPAGTSISSPADSPASPSPSDVRAIRYCPIPPARPPLQPAEHRFSAELLALHKPEHPISEQYRIILSAMEAQTPAAQAHVLLFTGATGRADTASVLLNLAITRARQGKGKLVVVDANLQCPSVAERLGLPGAPGLGEVLAGSVALRKVIQGTGLQDLYLLPAGQLTDAGHLLVASEAMRAILRHLRERFPWVFLAAPCWDGRPDVVALGSACDAVYLVVPDSEADAAAVEHLKQLIPLQGSRLRGCVCVQG